MTMNTHNNISPIGLREVFYLFWRRKYLIGASIILFLTSAILLLLTIEPRYSANAVLEIRKINDTKPTSQQINGQIEIIRSNAVALTVFEALDLLADKDFNPKNHFEDTQQILDQLLNQLSVKALNRSSMIRIGFQHPNAELTKNITNQWAKQYIDYQIRSSHADMVDNDQWLNTRLEELSQQLKKSSQAVERYHLENALTSDYQFTDPDDQAMQIKQQLLKAKSNLGEAKARLQQVNTIKNQKDMIETLPEIINSPLIQRLKQEETHLIRQLSELKTRYEDKHPQIINAKAELTAQRAKISQETAKIIQGFENNVELIQAQILSLTERMQNMQQERDTANPKWVRLQQLIQEAQTDQRLYEEFLTRYKSNHQQEYVQRSDIRIISLAELPQHTVWPNKFLIIFISSLAGLIFGITIALIIETLDDGYRTSVDLEKRYNIPVLMMIPSLENSNKKTEKQMADHIFDEPYSAIAEAVRSLRVSLSLRRDRSSQSTVISVTSSVPEEGKTTLSVWLARATAQAQKKTLLIDCDLRRPTMHQFFNDSNQITLVDVLKENKNVEDLISIDPKTGLHCIYARPMEKNDADIFSSGNIEKLITYLRSVYDVIILDTPPILSVSDTRILSKLSDRVLYAVQWKKTPREMVNTVMRHMNHDNIHIAGFVLTQVNMREHAQYHYSDMGAYYAQYHASFSKK